MISADVPRFLSVPYVIKARKSVLQAHELAPKRVVFLNLLIQLYAEIPTLLGGSIDFAEKKANELRDIDPVEGGMMQAYVFQVKNDFKASASKYTEVFQSLKDIFPDPENIPQVWFLSFSGPHGSILRIGAAFWMEPAGSIQ